MARFSRLKVATTMQAQGMVPLFYHRDPELAKRVVAACYKGGARLMEFTNRGDFAHEVFGEMNKFCAEECPEMIMGVGSVTEAATAALYMQMGANFVVTPVLREDIAIACNRRKVLWSPGCGSLTEITKAEELGCEIVKLFPGSTLGPGFVKAVRGPQPWTMIMPTGGVSPTEENLSAWFSSGVTCVGMGSKLISKELLADQNFEEIENRCRSCLTLIAQIRVKL
ncbi:MAG: bifunctional 4-hydroxy-2-oxoglutarate aldolase/2-dehydro-3-deoxy-phosphogluconate aldolase [Bacteroidota bacterium]